MCLAASRYLKAQIANARATGEFKSNRANQQVVNGYAMYLDQILHRLDAAIGGDFSARSGHRSLVDKELASIASRAEELRRKFAGPVAVQRARLMPTQYDWMVILLGLATIVIYMWFTATH
jgi:hypothetical protein